MAKSTIKVTTIEKKPEIVEKSVEESSGESDDSSVVSESSSEEEDNASEEEQDDASVAENSSSEKEASSKEISSSEDESSSVESSYSEESADEEEISAKEEEESSSKKETVEEASSTEEVSSAEKKTTTKESLTSAKNDKKRPASDKEEKPKKLSKLNDGGAKAVNSVENTIYVGQIILSATVEDIQKYFSSCGEIIDIRLGSFPNGQSKGYAYIDFSDAESKTNAKKLNGSELLGRPIKVSDATPPRDSDTDTFIKKTDTVFVGNLHQSITEDAVRELFKKFGTVKEIQIPQNNKSTGEKARIAFVKYSSKKEAADAIREMTGVTVKERILRLNFAKNKALTRGKVQGGRVVKKNKKNNNNKKNKKRS